MTEDGEEVRGLESSRLEGDEQRGPAEGSAEVGGRAPLGSDESDRAEDSGYTEEEEAEVTKRLEDLGYL